MKLLHICGEDEYSVLDFESMHIPVSEAYDKAFHSENGVWEFKPNGWATAVEFPNVRVTEDFITYIKSCLGDEDRMKAENFYIVVY